MKSKKNLTRFTYEKSAFQGWRLSISNSGIRVNKYFSDRDYGSPKAALEVAEEKLQKIKIILAENKLKDGKHTPETEEKVQAILKQ